MTIGIGNNSSQVGYDNTILEKKKKRPRNSDQQEFIGFLSGHPDTLQKLQELKENDNSLVQKKTKILLDCFQGEPQKYIVSKHEVTPQNIKKLQQICQKTPLEELVHKFATTRPQTRRGFEPNSHFIEELNIEKFKENPSANIQKVVKVLLDSFKEDANLKSIAEKNKITVGTIRNWRKRCQKEGEKFLNRFARGKGATKEALKKNYETNLQFKQKLEEDKKSFDEKTKKKAEAVIDYINDKNSLRGIIESGIKKHKISNYMENLLKIE